MLKHGARGGYRGSIPSVWLITQATGEQCVVTKDLSSTSRLKSGVDPRDADEKK